MAVKKSEIYTRIWEGCDVLRGSMDASQYKDYVLSILFIKYVSDKYAGHPYGAIKVPPGASFADMLALKGRTDIGDQINKKIIAPLAAANRLSGFPDFPRGDRCFIRARRAAGPEPQGRQSVTEPGHDRIAGRILQCSIVMSHKAQ